MMYIDQLNAFADAESVKEFLVMMGATGFRQDEMSCPISNWVGRMTGYQVITEDRVTVCIGPDWGNDDYVYQYPLSEAVRDFIYHFDLGHYPELDEDYDHYSD